MEQENLPDIQVPGDTSETGPEMTPTANGRTPYCPTESDAFYDPFGVSCHSAVITKIDALAKR